MEKQFFDKLLEETCPICYEDFELNDEVTIALPCLRHPFHKKCLLNFARSSATKDSQCPSCRVGVGEWLTFLISPRPVLPNPNPENIVANVTPQNANDLDGKFRPCCNNPFQELDGVAFPGPCFNHPMHETCYVIQRVGDFSAQAAPREVPCRSCGQILNNEVDLRMII